MTYLIGNARGKPGASEELIAICEVQLGFTLPEEYRLFLKSSNGCEGFLGPNAYVMIWSVEELVTMNHGYEVEKYLPCSLLFGSDGGGEAYAFDLRMATSSIVRVPFVGMSWADAITLDSSFLDFLKRLSE